MSHISLTGNWLSVNQKICDIVGFSKDELLKLTFQDITHPDDLGPDLALVEKMLRGEIQTYSLEKRYIKKDSSHVWINLTVSLVKDDVGCPLYFISVIEDIHQRKVMENQLRRIHEEMEQMIEKRTAALKIEIAERKRAEKERNSFFDLSSDLIAIFDYNGYLKAANPSLRRCLGYSEKELTSKRFIEFIHPDDLARTLEISAEFRSTGRFPGMENRYICKSGKIVLLSWSITGVPEDDCIYATARDITEIRRNELELTEQKMKLAADSKMNSLGRMASGIAHEINNPLTIVYGQTSTLKKMAASEQVDKSKLISISESMGEMCRRIVEIINGLRAFSRDATNDPFEFCSLKQVLQDTLAFCQGKMQNQNILLSLEPIPEDCELYCRLAQISQVILNLLNNAKDAAVLTSEKWIRIEFVKNEDQIGLAVVDSGTGVDSDHVAHLFQPFYTTKEIGKGTGLGLSISKGIIDVHDGRIYFDGEYPNTRFVFTLPIVKK